MASSSVASTTSSSSTPMSSVHSSRAGQPTRPGRADDGLTAPAPHPTTARPLAKAGGSTMFQTEQGTVRVQPYRAKGSKSLKALISFQPRESHFDLSGPGASDPFRGFFALFWIGLFLLFVQTAIKHYSRTGLLLSSEFAQLITADWRMLALTDAALILSSSLSVILVGGMRAGWWAYGNVVKTVQHVGQTAYLMAFVIWTVNCHWYWVQSGFLVLHAMVMLMKVHSYIAHNGHLANIALAKRQAEASLAKLLAANPGGREAALAEAHEGQLSAEAERRQLEREEARRAGLLIESANGSGIGPGSEVSTPGSESTLDLTTATTASPADDAHQHPHHLSEAALRQRLNVVSRLPSTPAASTSTTLAVSAASTSVSGPTSTKLQAALRPSAAHPLAFHPNDDIATTARNLDLYSAELTSTGAKRVTWPANVSVVNFIDYLLVPTLVYELEWPRTTKMRPIYVFEKVSATAGTFALIYLVTEHYIMPALPKPGDSMVVTFINLALPMTLDYLLIFYIMFECICNGFAELTYFADRRFAEDFWNSTSWDQFAKKWNVPVHTFLLRHVYTASLSTGKVSRNQATFLTFLLSACCHELVMLVVSRKLRFYLFALQMAQIPLIAVGRLPAIKNNALAGNVLFWLGLLSGFPLLAIGYLMY